MSQYQIVPCKLSHLRELARTMRPEDRAEIEAAGLIVRHALIALWRRSSRRRVAIVDGDVAIAWGDEAPLLAKDGLIWCFTSPAIERIPFSFCREARREVCQYLNTRRRLISEVAEDYTAARRFFALVGFKIGKARASASGARYCRMTLTRPRG